MQYYKYRFEVKNRPRKGYCLFNMHVADISGEEDGPLAIHVVYGPIFM